MSTKLRPIIYRVKIWRRSSDELEPAEDYFAQRSLSVGDVVDLWHDSQPRNFRVCSVMNGEIVVGEDSVPAMRGSQPQKLTSRQATIRERVVSDRGRLYRMSERSFHRYLTEGARTGSASASSYGKQVGDVDFYATGVNRMEFEYKLREVDRTTSGHRDRDVAREQSSNDLDPRSLKP